MSYPLVFTTETVLKPFKRTASYLTMVQQFQNGTEQRCPVRNCLMHFELPYPKLVLADKNAFKSFIASTKGQMSVSTSLTIGGVTYSDLTVTTDVFQAVENVTTQYGLTIPMRQIKPQTVTAATPGGTPAFPTLSGSIGMRPFTQAQRYVTIAADNSTGMRYTWGYFGTGLSGFPTRGLMAWNIQYSMLTDAQLDTLEQWFHWAMGRFKAFQFTDEDGTVYPNVRFDMDDFEIQYNSFNDSRVMVKLAEFFV